jgi:hypothetical protein
MNWKITPLILLSIVAGVAAAWFLAPKGDRYSVENLENVVQYITPEGYNVTRKVHELQNTEKGQRVALLPKQFDTGEFGRKPQFDRYEGYVGPDSCKECHQEYYDGFVQTAHYRTSALASSDSIRGSFEPGQNKLETRQPGFHYELVEEEGKHFQKLLVEENGKTYHHQRPFHVVTGSGNIGQTYLYWEDEFLFQLPVSWFSNGGWINSPGYPDGLANFARPIQDSCLACHTTMVDFAKKRINLADRSSMILGVTCERCHGPAEKHVAYHRANPDADAKFIIHPNDLPRERMNDVCGQCHSGGDSINLRPPFSFKPGDAVSDFKKFHKPPTDGGGVHTANQYPRLVKSECYIQSDSMNCASCHNPHQNEHGNLKLFSKRCMKCHQPKDCGQFPTSGQRIADNCIDCHMPKQDDQNTRFETTKKEIFPEIRDHFIRIEKEATRQVLDSWSKE